MPRSAPAATGDQLYRSFYTKSRYITDYMVDRLKPASGHKVLEPSAGDGEFIDALLGAHPGLDITALDMNPEAIACLQSKYASSSNMKIVHTDTLLDSDLDQKAAGNGYYDRIIGNPPYGAWQDYEKRNELKHRYDGFYVKETYSLFLLRCVSLLKMNGRLTFIIPDTFLNLHMHKRLREHLLLHTSMKEILLIPSSFFPGVKFGYANLAILTLEKSTQEIALQNRITIINGLKKVSDIEEITRGNFTAGTANAVVISQRDIYQSKDCAFLFKSHHGIRHFINNTTTTLDDIADCATGFYSGNNRAFLKVAHSSVRNLSGCEVIRPEEINPDYRAAPSLLDGLDSSSSYIPIVKGNVKGYLREDNWFVDWSREAVRHYKTDAKARFQNASFYFQDGVALPMVKSSKVSASLIQRQIFDQSIVGIFPRDKSLLYILLSLMNTAIVNTFIHTINHTANNSANYIKKIPVVIPADSTLETIRQLTKNQLLHWQRAGSADQEIDDELNGIYNSLYKL
ncbi:class I SAM-dependent methyltransferase [Paenibacillus oenotherae]|uniref:site-specific DNA-methyltransferase (adenine-specific) n=1 Tax=Paenibacillus oenotherae TaxID=1435645 RepID=A0ABS7D456_9BACL|nr:N-6 DNA methylase [Paenibacillus oenotherae]MBW7474709.1 class I SAM-dependent methyltransferase [Paenibacillus oenotherae]